MLAGLALLTLLVAAPATVPARPVDCIERAPAPGLEAITTVGVTSRKDKDRNQGPGAGQQQQVSLDEAVAMVQSRFRARAVKAETVNEGGRRVHRIRLLSEEGRVWTVRVDAASGRIQ